MTKQRCTCDAEIKRNCLHSKPNDLCSCACHDPKPAKKAAKKKQTGHKCLRCGAGSEWIA
jgi:hypothetical protein